MSKRKTRKQKKAADLRRIASFQQVSTPVFTVSQKTTSGRTTPAAYAPTYTVASAAKSIPFTHAYLVRDVSKTAMLTAAILIAQVLLFSILKKHLIILPNISY